MIRNLFFITFFINLTLPKAGIYFRMPGYIRFPVTLGYIIFLFLFLVCVISNRKNLRDIFLGSFIKKIGVFYLIYAFLRYFFIVPNVKCIGLIIEHYIIYAGYLLAFYLALDMGRYGEKIIPALVKIIVISMVIVSLYALLQVFFNSDRIALVGLTETYGSPKQPLITLSDESYLVQEGSASRKNSIFIKDDLGKRTFVGRKAFSTFHHGNLFGSHLVLFAPLIFSLLCGAAQRRQKIIYFCIALMVVLSLLFANSRGALIGFFISGLVFFLISTEKKKAFLFLISLLLGSILLFNLILNIAQRYNLRITSADVQLYRKVSVLSRAKPVFIPQMIEKDLASPDMEQDSVNFRLNRMSTYRYRDFKNFRREFWDKGNIKYLIFGRGYTSMAAYQNLYFNLLYNLGIVGFSLFLYIIIYILWMGIKGRDVPGAGVLVMGEVSGIAGFLTHSLFDNLFYFPPVGLNFWILNGLILAAANYKKKSDVSANGTVKQTGRRDF